MSFSNYLEDALLDHVLGGGDFTRPATVYLALYTAAPNDAGGGTEVTGGSYARKDVTNNGTNFPSASSGSKTTGADVVFATASASWGTVSHWGIFDAATSGNLLIHGSFTTAKAIGDGDTARVNTGSLTITLD